VRVIKSSLPLLLFALAALFIDAASAWAKKPLPPANSFAFRVCNKTTEEATVAIVSHTAAGSSQFEVEGWWSVGGGKCKTIGTFPIGNFYSYAEDKKGNGDEWSGTDTQQCVQYPGPFGRIALANYTCQANEKTRGFVLQKPANQETFTWNLN
jgi:uncharacterized membrane protein